MTSSPPTSDLASPAVYSLAPADNTSISLLSMSWRVHRRTIVTKVLYVWRHTAFPDLLLSCLRYSQGCRCFLSYERVVSLSLYLVIGRGDRSVGLLSIGTASDCSYQLRWLSGGRQTEVSDCYYQSGERRTGVSDCYQSGQRRTVVINYAGYRAGRQTEVSDSCYQSGERRTGVSDCYQSGQRRTVVINYAGYRAGRQTGVSDCCYQSGQRRRK